MVKGFIYIASAFRRLKPAGCVVEGDFNNDPHLWTKPYTWGICRPDLRKKVRVDDYVFFVLGSDAELPPMIFAYIKVGEIITHYQAYYRKELKTKRMTGKGFDGNILCDSEGNYNVHDKGLHEKTFEERRMHYVIADMTDSEFLTKEEIQIKSKDFVRILNKVLNMNGKTPYDIITRAGRRYLTESQTKEMLEWLTR